MVVLCEARREYDVIESKSLFLSESEERNKLRYACSNKQGESKVSGGFFCGVR